MTGVSQEAQALKRMRNALKRQRKATTDKDERKYLKAQIYDLKIQIERLLGDRSENLDCTNGQDDTLNSDEEGPGTQNHEHPSLAQKKSATQAGEIPPPSGSANGLHDSAHPPEAAAESPAKKRPKKADARHTLADGEAPPILSHGDKVDHRSSATTWIQDAAGARRVPAQQHAAEAGQVCAQ